MNHKNRIALFFKTRACARYCFLKLWGRGQVRRRFLRIWASAALAGTLLSGCGPEGRGTPTATPTPAVIETLSVQTAAPEPYALYYQKNGRSLGLYEPAKGCYLGAYILASKGVSYDIKTFEDTVQKPHALYSYYIHLGDAYPLQWVLSCMAAQKTPHFVVKPPADGKNPLDRAAVMEMAKAFADLYVPLFVEFYPDPRAESLQPEDYIEFYRYARDTFRTYASNAAFVWSVSAENVYDSMAYYPGDAYADWVGLGLYDTLGRMEDTPSYPDDKGPLDYFYFQFQKAKPMMITQYGVSHYSTQDHVYRPEEAKQRMQSFYKTLQADYPRIRAVTYMDFNGVEFRPGAEAADNFSVSDDEALASAYGQAVSSPWFLSTLEMSDTGDKDNTPYLSPFPAYKLDGGYFIAGNTLDLDLNMQGARSFADQRMIDGLVYYSLDAIEKSSGRTARIDDANKQIWFGGD